LQVVDAQHGLIACTLKRDPAFGDAEVIQDGRQPIISEGTRSDLSVAASPAGAQMGCDPWLDPREPVVALGEQEGEPHHGRPAEAQALPMAMGREVLVQSFGHAHFLAVGEDGRDVVDSCVGCGNFFAHPTSVTQFSFLRENSHEM